MPDAVFKPKHRWRWLWWILALASCAGIVFAGVWLVQHAPAFFHQSLTNQANQSNVASMFIGLVTLLVSVVALVVAVRQGRRAKAADLSPEERRELVARDQRRKYLGRRDQLPRVGDLDARAMALGVHPAIEARNPQRRLGRRWARWREARRPGAT
jgi:hypothetical protein